MDDNYYEEENDNIGHWLSTSVRRALRIWLHEEQIQQSNETPN